MNRDDAIDISVAIRLTFVQRIRVRYFRQQRCGCRCVFEAALKARIGRRYGLEILQRGVISPTYKVLMLIKATLY